MGFSIINHPFGGYLFVETPRWPLALVVFEYEEDDDDDDADVDADHDTD